MPLDFLLREPAVDVLPVVAHQPAQFIEGRATPLGAPLDQRRHGDAGEFGELFGAKKAHRISSESSQAVAR